MGKANTTLLSFLLFLSSLIYGVHLLHQHLLLYITAKQSLLHTKNEYWTFEPPCTSNKCLGDPSSIKLPIVSLDHTNHSMFKTFPDVSRDGHQPLFFLTLSLQFFHEFVKHHQKLENKGISNTIIYDNILPGLFLSFFFIFFFIARQTKAVRTVPRYKQC